MSVAKEQIRQIISENNSGSGSFPASWSAMLLAVSSSFRIVQQLRSHSAGDAAIIPYSI